MIARGYGESLPLHEACKLNPPADVVVALIRAYEPAVSSKGQWNFLPLHFAVRSNSLQAVVPLLEAYPRAARLKEDGGKLALHLGCQWGASPDVIERLLTLYPEGIYVRDDDGKSPTDYAEALKAHSKDDYDKILAAMERGLVYCAVSKAAFFRVKEEFDELMRGTVEAHNTHVTKLEKAHSEEIEVHRQLEDGLRSNLKHMGEKQVNLRDENGHLKDQKMDLGEQLNILENAESLLRSQTDRLQTMLEQKGQEFTDKEAALERDNSRMVALTENLDAVTSRNSENDKEIEALTKMVLSLSASIDALTVQQQFAEDALAKQDKALRMVLADSDALANDTLQQKEQILIETNALEDIILSADVVVTEEVQFPNPVDSVEKDTGTVVTSANSFSSAETDSIEGEAKKEELKEEGVVEEPKEEESAEEAQESEEEGADEPKETDMVEEEAVACLEEIKPEIAVA